jgi:GDPmannose 4,6-dehydratase
MINAIVIKNMNILNISDARSLIKSNTKTVFVTGVTGQDGSHMVDYLLKNTDHMIFGGVRRLSVPNHDNLKNIDWNSNRFALVNFDLTDSHATNAIVKELQPDYFINLAAQTFVGSSWDFPAQTWECNTTGVIHILEAIRQHKPTCRIYNAGSSEELGNVEYTPQDEKHPVKPRSPYGASKAAARQLIKVYRESYNLYAIQGLLFNHEGTRRGEEFVTRKITKGVARISKAINNKQAFEPIELGNIYAQRDWSDAEDFVDGIWRMLNQDIYRNDINDLIKDFDKTGRLLLPRNINPAWHSILVKNLKEYVLSSNETHTIKEFVQLAFDAANIQGVWHGNGINEEFSVANYLMEEYNIKSSVLVKINPKFYRPAEVDLLLGNSKLARNELGWSPTINFKKLVEKMVRHDLSL